MKKNLFKFLLLSGSMIGLTASAQTARVQIIHNCPDAAAATVDVWLDTTRIINNFNFRTASAFIDAPAGVPINIGIAVDTTSTSASQAAVNFPITLMPNETYVVVANGIVNAAGYNPAPAFDLDVYPAARETGISSTNTDILVAHGSTDAPFVDVETSNTTLVNNLGYGSFAGYLSVPTANLNIEVTDSTGASVVRSYLAPLQTLNLQGKAITVVASGFLNTANNSNSANTFGLWAATAAGGNLIPLPASTARVQVIHNCADAAASTVDVWLDNTRIINNFNFRTASSFIDAPAGVPINIGIAVDTTSTSASQAAVNFPLTLMPNETYVVVANGIVNAAGYNPAPAFDLDVYPTARETGISSTNTDILVAHGSTDAPFVDVETSNTTLVNNLGYGSFAGYLSVPTANLNIEVTDSTGATVVRSYLAPLQTLNLQGKAITVVASGFLNTANNSNSTNTFGLWAATSAGGNLIPLPASTARVQVIHNCADAAASTVDVWLGNTRIINNFNFRTASSFIDAPAGVPINIGIAVDTTSTSASQAAVNFPLTLMPNETYVVVANGIVNAAGYNPAPAFDLDIYPTARETGISTMNTDILVVHGSTDAPFVDVETSNNTLINNLGYGSFAGYLSVPTANLNIEVTDSTGATVVRSYSAPLQTLNLQGKAITVVASGFLNTANNSNSTNTFGLWVATATGGNLIPLPANTTSIINIADNAEITMFPNPSSDNVSIQLGTTDNMNIQLELIDLTGRVVLSKQINNNGQNVLTNVFNVSEISNGTYTLSIVSNNKKSNSILIVNHK